MHVVTGFSPPACYVARLLMPRGRSHAARPRNLSALSNCVNYLGKRVLDGSNLFISYGEHCNDLLGGHDLQKGSLIFSKHRGENRTTN